MTTETTTEATTPAAGVPPPSPDRQAGGFRFVNIAEGTMGYKPSKTAERVLVEKIEGQFVRVGFHESHIGQTPQNSLEVEVHERDGTKVLLQVNQQNSVGCGMLAAIALAVQAGTWVSITSTPTKEKNDYGKYGTFVNGMVYNGTDWVEINTSKKQFGESSWKDLLDDILEKIEKHPNFAMRAKNSGGDTGGFDVFCQALKDASVKFPDPNEEGAEDAYCTWFGAVLEEEFSGYDSIKPEYWVAIVRMVEKAAKLPPVLKVL